MEPALFQCWHTDYNAGPTFGQRCRITIKPGALPSKHERLTQCCFNVGPTSKTAGQHSNNIHLDHSIVFAGLMFLTGHVPANTRRWPKVVLLLGRRRKRGPTVKQHWVSASCLLGCLIQICTHSGRYMHTAYFHGDSTVYQLRPTLSGWYCWCISKVTCHAWRHLI